MPQLSNPRHERFAQELAKGSSADEAYCLAGYRPNRGNASVLKANQSVKRRVAELMERAAMRTEITLASVTESLLRIAKTAEEEGGAPGLSVARAAWMDAAKINGLVVDRSETVSGHYAISDELPTAEEWEAEHCLPDMH